LRTADELDSGEERNAARKEHGEGAQDEVPLKAALRGRLVPARELPAARLVVHVVEQARLRYQQGVALERSLCDKEHDSITNRPKPAKSLHRSNNTLSKVKRNARFREFLTVFGVKLKGG